MPPAEPSIKGIVVQLAVDAINGLLAEGRLSRDALEARLEAADLGILDQKVLPGLWYPLTSFDRLLDVATADARTDGGLDAVAELGKQASARLLASEHYGALVDAAQGAGKLAGPRLLRLAPLLCSFGRWSFKPDGKRVVIEVSEATGFPEMLGYLAQGLIAYLSERVSGRPVQVSSRRPAPDRIAFTIAPA